MQEIINHFAQNFHGNPALECPNNCNCSNDCRRCLRKQYFHNPISYSCNNRRIMYILSYLYAHSSEMYYLFSDYSEQIFSHLRSNTLKLRAIGAGPGSEIMGFLRFIGCCEYSKIDDIFLQRVESETGWDAIYIKCMKIFEQIYQLPPNINIQKTRYHKNVMSNPNFKNNCNILVFSHFWSEYLDNANNLDIWSRLIMNNDRKSVIILNDRQEKRIEKLFDKFIEYSDDYIKEYFERDLTRHCGLHYDDSLKQRFGPKLYCKSHQRIILLES